LTHHFALIQIKALKTMRDIVIEGDKVVLYGPNSSGKSTVIHFPPLALTEFSASQYHNSDVLPGLTLEKAKAVVKFREHQVEIGGYNLSARRDGTGVGGGALSPALTAETKCWSCGI
jgi:predicted ATPase